MSDGTFQTPDSRARKPTLGALPGARLMIHPVWHLASGLWHRRIALVGSLALLPWPAEAQGPAPGACPPQVPGRRVGPIRRAFRHTSDYVHEHIIGDPALFVEPPLGA